MRPSELQSEMGQPWSRVEKGQAPLLMWRYQAMSGPGQSSLTCMTAEGVLGQGLIRNNVLHAAEFWVVALIIPQPDLYGQCVHDTELRTSGAMGCLPG